MIGAAALPEPFGLSCPVQLLPAFRQTRFPGCNVTPLILESDFHAVAGVAPSPAPLPPFPPLDPIVAREPRPPPDVAPPEPARPPEPVAPPVPAASSSAGD